MNRLCLTDTADRDDLIRYLDRIVDLDPAAVVRLVPLTPGRLAVWAHTGFDVLVVRPVAATCTAADTVVSAAGLRGNVAVTAVDEPVDVGPDIGGTWVGALPSMESFAHVEDVPAGDVVALYEQGRTKARTESGPFGPPPSLLDSIVLTASSHGAPGTQVRIPLRMVLALGALGFIRETAGERVRVRSSGAWLRLDARCGTVCRRRDGFGLTVL